jgi:hypothetical protein
MVEPLTMALFAAAELVLGKLGRKALDAILEPTDEVLKTQVKALMGRDLSKVRQTPGPGSMLSAFVFQNGRHGQLEVSGRIR